MPDLQFSIDGAETVPYAASPTLALGVRIANTPADETIHSVLLRTQVRIDAQRRRYTDREQTQLFDLFGEKQDWGRTVGSLLWARVDVNVPAFTGQTTVDLPVPCSVDMNLAAGKYFHGVDDGEVPLSVLFSGTVFYASPQRPLQVAQISWEKEAVYRLPVRLWQETIDHYFPNTAWLPLRKDIFDRIAEFKRRGSFTTWEKALEALLADRPASDDETGLRFDPVVRSDNI